MEKTESYKPKNKFLSGSIDNGINGSIPLLIFPNDYRTKGSKQPHYKAFIKNKETGKLKEVGAFWIKDKSEKPNLEIEVELGSY